MPTKIHNERILDKDQMLFKYATGVEGHPPKTPNFLPKLNTLHHLFRVTMAPGLEMPPLVLNTSGISFSITSRGSITMSFTMS
jgi:hypothetical protein